MSEFLINISEGSTYRTEKLAIPDPFDLDAIILRITGITKTLHGRWSVEVLNGFNARVYGIKNY